MRSNDRLLLLLACVVALQVIAAALQVVALLRRH